MHSKKIRLTKNLNNLRNVSTVEKSIEGDSLTSLLISCDGDRSRSMAIKLLKRTLIHGEDFKHHEKILSSHENVLSSSSFKKFIIHYASHLPPLSRKRVLIIDEFSNDFLNDSMSYAAFKTIAMYANDNETGLTLILITNSEHESFLDSTFNNTLYCTMDKDEIIRVS